MPSKVFWKKKLQATNLIGLLVVADVRGETIGHHYHIAFEVFIMHMIWFPPLRPFRLSDAHTQFGIRTISSTSGIADRRHLTGCALNPMLCMDYATACASLCSIMPAPWCAIGLMSFDDLLPHHEAPAESSTSYVCFPCRSCTFSLGRSFQY